MIDCVGDFETRSLCDLKVCGAHRYAQDPSTEVICFAFEFKGEVFVWTPGDGTTNGTGMILMQLVARPDVMFVAHNAGFEKAIWRNIMVPVFGFPDIPNSRWDDTQAGCAMRVIPQDLDRALVVLRLPFSKDREGSELVKQQSKPNKQGYLNEIRPDVLDRIYSYCSSDINGTVGLRSRLGPLPSGERQVWLLDQRINERGARLDMAFVRAAQAIVAGASKPLLGEFSKLTGGLKPTQVQKFGQWVKDAGVVLPDMKKETLAALLGSNEDGEDAEFEVDNDWFAEQEIPAEVHRALSIRQLIGSASIKKLGRMEHCVCFDGRARGLLQYHGAGPGLWAGRLFQPQNFPRGTVQIAGKDGKKKAPPPQLVVDAIMTGDHEYVAQTVGPPVEVVVSGLRHCIVSSPGRRLVAGDFAGIQARAVLALAGQHDKTAIMAAGKDIYLDMASAIYKRSDLTKEANVEERQIGKNTVLGLGFQMGARKFRFRYAKDQPEAFAENIVQVYRKEWAPQVPKLWYALEGAAVRTAWDKKAHEAYGIEYRYEDGWITARLPSGRKLWYYNPQPIKKAMPWDEDDIRLAWTYQARKQGQMKTIDAFGGLLTENVVMGMQRDLLTSAMFKCEQNNLPIILNVHDEIICEPEEKYADPNVLVQIMTDIPQWAREIQIPVAVEAWSGDRYKK